MKVIDEKGRLFGLINIFDLLVILALFIILAAVGFRLAQKSSASQADIQKKTYVAIIKCSSMPEKFSETLMKDPRIYYDSDGFVNGKVTGVTQENAVILVAGSGGQVYQGHDPKLKDVYVTMEIEDNTGDASIKLGRYSVSVGGKLTVKTIYAAGVDGLVMDLYEKK